MIDILDKVQKIRGLFNAPWQREVIFSDKIKWNKACACMDVIEDSQLAILNYIDLPQFSAEKGGYLYLYGLLQALFLQQDAINNLSEALFNKKINWESDYPNLFKIRELRNDAIGHPTSRNNNKSFHFITRYSLNKTSFELSSHFPNEGKMERKQIFIKDILEQHENSISSVLEKVTNIMDDNLKTHKKMFSNNKIADQIPDTWSYYISKVYDGVFSNHQLAEMHFKLIMDVYENIKKAITERYSSIKALPGIEDEVRKLDYISAKIQHWIDENTLYKNMDAEVFLDCFVDRFEDLKEMLVEIDRDFEIQ